ncbi:hypothetical protein B0H14DRAFT_2254046, partial [Mycena olivaceomarginata]
IESAVNLKNDCASGKCVALNTAPILQEREVTRITRPRIRHTDDVRFVVNTTALHNYRQISSAIPRSLSRHSFAVPDQ